MKIFITCAVIASLLAVAITIYWPGSGASKTGKTSVQQTEGGPLVKRVVADRLVAPETPEAEEIPRPEDKPMPQVPGKVGPEVSGLDALEIYDVLLTLNFSADNQLLVDRNTRAVLQMMYDQLGDPVDEQREENLQALLREALPQETAQQLLDLLQDYSAYTQAVDDLRRTQAASASSGAVDPLHHYDQVKALRRSYLNEEVASGMFAEEEAQLPYMVEAMAVTRDPNLSQEERAQKLAALQAEFNDTAIRMNSPLAAKVLEAKVARLRAEGASEAEIFAVRNEVLGSAEAQRLAEADQAEDVHQ